MLKALYDYGIRNELAIPPGFLRKPIRAYICLSGKGDFLGILQCSNETQVCPDIGSLANGPDKCNPLAEKKSVILEDSGKKTEFYRKLLKDGSNLAPQLAVCLGALEAPETYAAMCREAEEKKVKKQDRISFQVDGVPIVLGDGVRSWWSIYRKGFLQTDGKKDAELVPCLITGEPTVPLSTVPVVNGLQVVGGHSRGEALFCFDKNAFQSYGLKKSANAPVSEEAFSVVKDALNDLIAGAPAMYRREKSGNFQPMAPVYAGMKFLHWYDCPLAPEEDPILPVFSGFEDDEEDDALSEEEAGEQALREAVQAKANADKLIESVNSGEKQPLFHAHYYILLLSGNNGRVVVRRYEHGSYETLQKNLALWNEDLALADDFGTGVLRPCKMTARLLKLVKDQGSTGKKLFDQLKKELAGVTPMIITAILNGSQLPDTVAVRSLSYIRSQMLSKNDEENTRLYLPDGRACQWLKVWLIRKRRARNEGGIPVYYDNSFPNAAYHCGALVAIYVNLQNAAMGKVNAGIVQRYYASASRTPTMVLGTLERMGQVYLSQLSKDHKEGLANIYQERLNKVYAFFGKDGGHALPPALNLEEQSFFALGYRQMCTQITADINAAKAKKQEEM